MSRFMSEKRSTLVPYTPGEQPRERTYIKLNTNESPFPPSDKAILGAARAAERLHLYSDPTCKVLVEALADMYDVSPECVICTNGSDEVLDFAFQAFCDDSAPAVFPDITYGFYPVFAERNGIPYHTVPLNDDLTVNVADYCGTSDTVFIANPNAPTGIPLTVAEIERIVTSNPDRVVIIDEAYVDFGAESSVPLTKKYDNLLVTQTFSKSRSMAGARLGFGIGNAALISDLHTVRYATNPYNVNSMTMLAGLGVLADEDYTRRNCATVMENRAYTQAELQKRGFVMTDSYANFVFAKHPELNGEKLYLKLKEMGILVRHFNKDRISDYNRITVGKREDMQALIDAVDTILKEGL